MITDDRVGAGDVVRSDLCEFGDLLDPLYLVTEADRAGLDLVAGWSRRWSAHWRISGHEVACPVRSMGSVPAAGRQPVRRFSWHTKQRHRLGQQAMVSTGRLHGFESIAERNLLLVLDFAGQVLELLSQPMRLRFFAAGQPVEHIPDFLVRTGMDELLIDVRPEKLIGADDRIKFAAASEAALACGWRYAVVVGWRRQVLTVLDDLSAQRRPLVDQLGVQESLLAAVRGGPRPFGELVEATGMPAVARAHARHLLWHRRLGIDLAGPLGDASLVWAAGWRDRR